MGLLKGIHLCPTPRKLAPGRPGRSIRKPCCARGLNSDESMAGDDAAFMAELASLRDRLQKPDPNKRRMLEITWQVRDGAAKEGRPKRCNACVSRGTVECKYCHGTGVMQLGDTLYCSDTGCSVCPVCGGDVRSCLSSCMAHNLDMPSNCFSSVRTQCYGQNTRFVSCSPVCHGHSDRERGH